MITDYKTISLAENMSEKEIAYLKLVNELRDICYKSECDVDMFLDLRGKIEKAKEEYEQAKKEHENYVKSRG